MFDFPRHIPLTHNSDWLELWVGESKSIPPASHLPVARGRVLNAVASRGLSY